MEETNFFEITNQEEADEFLKYLKRKEKQDEELSFFKHYAYLTRGENNVVNEDISCVVHDSAHDIFPYSGKLVVEKIVDYAYTLDDMDYDSAHAIELMLLKLFSRACSDRLFERICNISDNAKKKRPNGATYKFHKGAKTNIYNEFKR